MPGAIHGATNPTTLVERALGRRLVRQWELAGGQDVGWWESARSRAPSSLARTLRWPRSATVIGVAGSTLGGSGRTPVAIALVAALAARGRSVALVGHAYGARPLRGRVVVAGDSLEEVGDEAAIAARALGAHAPVVVGPDRQSALDHAADLATIVVVDRLAAARPVRLHASVLALDATSPWGSGRLFPLGDLTHPRAHLLASADVVVDVGGDGAESRLALTKLEDDGDGDGDGDVREPVRALAGASFGLITSAARPDRIVRQLAGAGLRARVHVERGDHAPLADAELARFDLLGLRAGVARWLVDAKTAIRIARGRPLALPVARLDQRVILAPAVVDAIVATIDARRG